jgi:hypothetical protein
MKLHRTVQEIKGTTGRFSTIGTAAAGEPRAHHMIAHKEVDEADPSAAAAPSPAAGVTPGQARQAQCWPSGICRCTEATWRPQPDQVDLPHVPHFTW